MLKICLKLKIIAGKIQYINKNKYRETLKNVSWHISQNFYLQPRIINQVNYISPVLVRGRRAGGREPAAGSSHNRETLLRTATFTLFISVCFVSSRIKNNTPTILEGWSDKYFLHLIFISFVWWSHDWFMFTTWWQSVWRIMLD